jgi:hypothetical protein
VDHPVLVLVVQRLLELPPLHPPLRLVGRLERQLRPRLLELLEVLPLLELPSQELLPRLGPPVASLGPLVLVRVRLVRLEQWG